MKIRYIVTSTGERERERDPFMAFGIVIFSRWTTCGPRPDRYLRVHTYWLIVNIYKTRTLWLMSGPVISLHNVCLLAERCLWVACTVHRVVMTRKRCVLYYNAYYGKQTLDSSLYIYSALFTRRWLVKLHMAFVC